MRLYADTDDEALQVQVAAWNVVLRLLRCPCDVSFAQLDYGQGFDVGHFLSCS